LMRGSMVWGEFLGLEVGGVANRRGMRRTLWPRVAGQGGGGVRGGGFW